MSITDEIKQKADIVEVIGSYVQLTKSGRTMRLSQREETFFLRLSGTADLALFWRLQYRG
jgi:hypothetical protein